VLVCRSCKQLAKSHGGACIYCPALQTACGPTHPCLPLSVLCTAGLLCLKTAWSGGKSELASSITIYNELLKRDPQIIQTLVRHLTGSEPCGQTCPSRGSKTWGHHDVSSWHATVPITRITLYGHNGLMRH
jgi:hypothetical protein